MLSIHPVTLNDQGPSQLDYARTPGRVLLKNRGGLQENAAHRGSMTMNAKGKATTLRTPFNPTSHAKKALQTGNPTVVVTKPLGDKTPFPNRQAQPLRTPAPEAAKIAKLSLLGEVLEKAPGCLLLPSARRKSMRLPRSVSKNFRTPHVQGNHWDVSDGDLQVDVSEDIAEAAVEKADYDEIEYMPPKVPEQPFEPLFELPDYKIVGKTLLNLAYYGPRDDSADVYYKADIETVIDTTKLLEDSGAFAQYTLQLPELGDHDPFQLSPPSTRVPSRATTTRSSSRADSVKPVPVPAPTSRTAQSLVRPTPPVTRSSSRTLPPVSQGSAVATTRVTRSATVNAAGSSRLSRLAQTSNAPHTTVPTKKLVVGTTQKLMAPPVRAPPAKDARPRPGIAPCNAPVQTNAAPSGSRIAAPARTSGATRIIPKTVGGRPASAASITIPTDDILQFDTAIVEDDFQFIV